MKSVADRFRGGKRAQNGIVFERFWRDRKLMHLQVAAARHRICDEHEHRIEVEYDRAIAIELHVQIIGESTGEPAWEAGKSLHIFSLQGA